MENLRFVVTGLSGRCDDVGSFRSDTARTRHAFAAFAGIGGLDRTPKIDGTLGLNSRITLEVILKVIFILSDGDDSVRN